MIDDRLIVGGIFKSGEELMRIQPIDFELAVDQREADLALARMQHELELGRQEVAKREWQLLGDKQPVEASRKRLALRVPQLRQAEIALTAAESALQRAQLDLDRTIIRSPFNASVLSENAEKGQLITATGNICRLVCTDDYYVITSLPQNMARHIRTLEDHGIAAKARIHTPGSGMREGTVIRFLSDLESNSRMARWSWKWRIHWHWKMPMAGKVIFGILCETGNRIADVARCHSRVPRTYTIRRHRLGVEG